MLFSVIIPVYNVEEFLEECLDSVLAQTYQNFEVVLVNDGSTDRSSLICKEYCSLDNRFKYIEKLNGGQSEARNIGIQAAGGEYIVFLDSDDFWEGDFLSNIANIIKEHNPDFLFFRHKYYYNTKTLENKYVFNSDELRNMSGEECLKYILELQAGYGWWVCLNIVKKELIINESLLFEKNRLYEDVMWTPEVFLCSKKVFFYDKAIYMYRQGREGQSTSLLNKKIIEDNIYSVYYWEKKLCQKYMHIDSQLKDLIMSNVSMRYFISIAFVGFLKKDMFNESIDILKKNKRMLNYHSSFFTKSIYYMCSICGFKITSLIFKHLITLKRKVKR